MVHRSAACHNVTTIFTDNVYQPSILAETVLCYKIWHLYKIKNDSYIRLAENICFMEGENNDNG